MDERLREIIIFKPRWMRRLKEKHPMEGYLGAFSFAGGEEMAEALSSFFYFTRRVALQRAHDVYYEGHTVIEVNWSQEECDNAVRQLKEFHNIYAEVI